MYKLAEAYDQIKDYLLYFLRLHKILNDRGMEEQEIINVLELANDHQLQHLQWKVEYLRNDIEMLEAQKTKSTNYLLNLNRRLDEFQGTLSRYESSLPQAYMNQGLIRYDNTNNLYPIPYSEPGSSSYSIRLNYTPMTDEWLWQ
jgi:chromosome segregation ATPase